MIASNNIFNIRYSALTKWKGQIGMRKGFVEFKELSFGIRAWLIVMRTYRHKYGCKCIRDIVTRYAPPSENNTGNYITYCSKYVAIALDQELLSQEQYYKLAVAMARMETSTELTPWTVENVATFYNIKIVSDGSK